MKAFIALTEKRFGGLASSFSLTEKLIHAVDHDEHSTIGILTPGFLSRLHLPSLFDQWLWRFVSRHSGATVLDFHKVP